MKQEMMKIVSNEEIASDIYEMKLTGSICQEIREPGQFIHIKLEDESMLLRRPISISSYDYDQLTILYKVLGKGTKTMSHLTEGQTLDVLGPLGNGFKLGDVDENAKILIIGAGIGIAPLYQLAKNFYIQGRKIDVVLSYKCSKEAYYIEKFFDIATIYLSTDDGSLGMRGYCEDLIKTLKKDYDYVYACGPQVVLKFIQNYYRDLDNVYLSLEQRMGCGIGACHACDTKDKKKRICKDGPVFNAKEVEI